MNPQDPSPHTSAQPQPDANSLAPAFPVGTKVEVIVNDRNRTHHQGVIVSAIWHHNAKTWHYRLVCNGKKISKRYEACDLRAVL